MPSPRTGSEISQRWWVCLGVSAFHNFPEGRPEGSYEMLTGGSETHMERGPVHPLVGFTSNTGIIV